MPDPNLLISLAILAAIGLAVWIGRKDGRANPVSTSKVEADVKQLSTDLTTKVAGLNERVAKIETSIENIRDDLDSAPTKADIAMLKGEMGRIEERIAGVMGHIESIDQAVVRIDMFLRGEGPVAQAIAARPRRKS